MVFRRGNTEQTSPEGETRQLGYGTIFALSLLKGWRNQFAGQ